jgi:transcriptional regulator with XRE-family HTH domain
MLGARLKELREINGLVQRQIAAALEVDTAFISKVEKEEKLISKKHISPLAKLFKISEDEILSIWLADKILKTIYNEKCKVEALQIVLKNINQPINK